MSETTIEKELTMDVPTAPESINTGDTEKNIQRRTELKIDKEFQFLIPSLSQEEYDQLEMNIVKDGCIDPIVVWSGHDTILDGHNRYRICNKNRVEFRTHPMDLGSREDAINWIINNQLGRRNLTERQISYLRGKKYNTEKKGSHRPEKGDQSDHVKTSDKIAEESKVGSATVRRDAKFATAVDRIKEDVGEDFGKKLLTEETKLPKSDIIKLAEKPVDEKKALVTEIQKGAKRLSQAEEALKTVNKTQVEVFDKADPEIDFAGWSWNPHKLEAPKNTQAPQKDSKIKQKLVYLNEDIFSEGFNEDETEMIVKIMRESPQWVFMVHTSELERLSEIDWPLNVWIGCVIESQDSVKPAIEAFIEINGAIKFVICDLHKESIAFDRLKGFNWIIIRNLSKVQPYWQRVESVLEMSLADSLWIYLMPNITVRPMEYPRLQEQNVGSQTQEVVSQEPVKAAA